MPHLGVATLVGSTQLCGMVDSHVELVFARRAVRHASATTTILDDHGTGPQGANLGEKSTEIGTDYLLLENYYTYTIAVQ